MSAMSAPSELSPTENSSGSTTPKGQVELTDQTNRLPFKKLLPIFAGLALCVVVSSLDSVIVATVIPTISTAFNAGSVVSWVPLRISPHFDMLPAAIWTILRHFWSQERAAYRHVVVYGRKFASWIFQDDHSSDSLPRSSLAGAGGGGLVSMSQIVISDIVSLRERGKYQGIISGVIAIGYCLGPVIGGAFAQQLEWEWCFWVTFPVSFLAACVVAFILPLKPVQGDIRSKLLAVDYIGTLLTLVGCTLFILPLIWGGVTFPWTSPMVLAPLLSAFVVVAIFCLWEWKGARLPIVPMYIFKYSTVTGVFIGMFINGFVFFSTLYYLPQFFQVALGYDPLHAGLFLIPFLVTQVFSSWGCGMLMIINSGFAVWSIACGLISTIRPRSHKALLVVYMILAGVGAGQTMQTSTVAVQASVPRRDMAVVTAMRNFIRLLGGTLSLAVAATLLNNDLHTAMAALNLPSSQISQIIDDPVRLHTPASVGISADIATDILDRGYAKGFSSLFIMNAALTVFATLVSVVMIKHKELSRDDDEMLRQKAIREVLETKFDMVSGAGTLASGTASPMGGMASGTVTPRDLESGRGLAAQEGAMVAQVAK
ncbi:MFS drug transporter [Mycena venus]|uniref:MFS drug transporter n=1 Tax=Mycena venus TaxID=2733690 RepID=A0A8H6X5P4_9AGAR|nr:MFS drug transporter [Mycena venus]